MKTHRLKLHSKYFEPMYYGKKTFTIRLADWDIGGVTQIEFIEYDFETFKLGRKRLVNLNQALYISPLIINKFDGVEDFLYSFCSDKKEIKDLIVFYNYKDQLCKIKNFGIYNIDFSLVQKPKLAVEK